MLGEDFAGVVCSDFYGVYTGHDDWLHAYCGAHTIREAKKIAELREHGISGAHIFVHEGGDGVQRVEQEVRLKLQSQVFELRLGELGL